MADLENSTPFAARVMPSIDRDGIDVLLIVVAAHFALPEAGDGDSPLHVLPIQELPPLADEFVGETAQSSIRREGQSSYTKPATDIYVWGEACAANGRPVTMMDVHIRVGPCAVDLQVFGDRVWQHLAGFGAMPSDPAPFLRMPLVWERAYGGVAANSTAERPSFEPRNPIGCGFETDVGDAVGRPLPNIEHPRERLRGIFDRPQPMGVGPVARHWQPRINYAGTYDDSWKRKRAPLWPHDFDTRFFCGAPSYLQAAPHLCGGEPVALAGLSPGGPIKFRLPLLRFAALSRFANRDVTSTPVLDGVLIETGEQRLTLYYRSSVPAPLSLVKHRGTLLRLTSQLATAVPQ